MNISHGGMTVSVTEGAGPNSLANNVISRSKTAAILGMDHLEMVTEDLGEVGAKVPELIKLNDNMVI